MLMSLVGVLVITLLVLLAIGLTAKVVLGP